MKHLKNDATHFLSCEDRETGTRDLLDCIPLESKTDKLTRVVVFSDHDDSWKVEVVRSERVLSVEDVSRIIINQVTNDLVLLDPEDEQTVH